MELQDPLDPQGLPEDQGGTVHLVSQDLKETWAQSDPPVQLEAPVAPEVLAAQDLKVSLGSQAEMVFQELQDLKEREETLVCKDLQDRALRQSRPGERRESPACPDPLEFPERRASLDSPVTQDSQELMDDLVSLDPLARKETQASQESPEDQELPAPKEPWERWASQAPGGRKERPVCLDGPEVPDNPERQVSLDLKVNPDQQESALQEYRDRRERPDSQVSLGPQDRKEPQDHPVCLASLEVQGPKETPVCQDSKVLPVSLVLKVWTVLLEAQD